MFHRTFNPSLAKSFFLFGARGTGKSTYIQHQWGQPHHYINLLLDKWERRYLMSPDRLIADLDALKKKPKWIVIDEIQKVPKLLDVVHTLIESKGYRFALTGSSARKLRRSASNLLAGRAFSYGLFPLTSQEMGRKFDLDFTLNWGALPTVFSLKESDRAEYLKSYCQSYLREEVLQEQLVRNVTSFRSFLEISAQASGKTINYSKIAKDVGADVKTVQNFFQILEDTLIGTMLPSFTRSARKSVRLQPKFYLFDLGIKRAMEGVLPYPLQHQTSAFGSAFEHFIVLEIIRINSYKRYDYQLFHYQTTAGGEIDLILHRGKEIIAIEIKSSNRIDDIEVRKLSRVAEPLSPSKVYYISQDEVRTKISGVTCIHWQDFLENFT